MSEESRQEEEQGREASAELDLSSEEKTGPGKTALAALLLALIALAAGAGALYAEFQSRDTVQSRSRTIDDLRSQMQSMDDRLGELVSRRQALTERLEGLREEQRALADSVDTLYRRQKQDNIDWAVAEIEHLMVIAVHSLTLQRDLDTALAALQAADDRLRDLGEPGLTDVRRRLTADINALKAVDDVDIGGLSLYLADVAGRVEELPVQERSAPQPAGNAAATTAPDESKPAWKRLLAGVWREIKSLVVITRSDDAGRALLMPEERYFLYQNLRLQLESARMAVFRRDTQNFRSSLDLVINWLEEYFRTDSNAVGNVVQSLEEMRKLKLERDLPDISSSLETLRAWIKERARSATSGNGEAAP